MQQLIKKLQKRRYRKTYQNFRISYILIIVFMKLRYYLIKKLLKLQKKKKLNRQNQNQQKQNQQKLNQQNLNQQKLNR